jgi:nucleoid DNA-binding protein
LDVLEKLEPEQCVYLAGIGWLQMKRYARYEGRDPVSGQQIDVPAKYGLFYVSDPELGVCTA